MSNWHNPRYQRDYRNRRQHVKYDAWPGDIYHIPLPEVNYMVGSDGASLTRYDYWDTDSEIERRLHLTRMHDA